MSNTLDQKTKALEAKEQQLLAAIKVNSEQVEQLQAHRQQLDQERIAVFGAKRMIVELLEDEKKAAADEPAKDECCGKVAKPHKAEVINIKG